MFKVGVIMQDKGDTAKRRRFTNRWSANFLALMGPNKRKNALTHSDDYGMTRNRIISGLVA